MVIVGAGIIGLCTADKLVSQGHRVTVLDREPKPGEGCSYGNGGMIVPSHFVPLAAPGMIGMGLKMMLNKKSPFGIDGITDLDVIGWVARFMRAANKGHAERCAPLLSQLNLASRKLYTEYFSTMASDAGFAERGMLMLCSTPKGLDHEAELAKQGNALGLHTRVLDRAGIAELEPDLQINAIGGVYFQDDAHFTPSAFMAALTQHLMDRGAEVRYGVDVSRVQVRGRKVVSVEDIEADEVVFAGGSWTGELAKTLGLRMPMLAGRGFGTTVTNPPQTPRCASIMVEARVAVTPMTDGVRFVACMELGKPKLTPNLNRVQGMREGIEQTYPAYRFSELATTPIWTGLRPCTPDGLPYLGRTQQYDNIVIAAGHAMMGMSLGPITGKLVSEVIAGDTPSIPLDLLSPDRYV